jgi:hypothetical protein
LEAVSVEVAIGFGSAGLRQLSLGFRTSMLCAIGSSLVGSLLPRRAFAVGSKIDQVAHCNIPAAVCRPYNRNWKCDVFVIPLPLRAQYAVPVTQFNLARA